MVYTGIGSVVQIKVSQQEDISKSLSADFLEDGFEDGDCFSGVPTRGPVCVNNYRESVTLVFDSDYLCFNVRVANI